MHTVSAVRRVVMSGAAALLTGCVSTDGTAPQETAANVASQPGGFESGTVPDYCPEVELREGTGVLREENGGETAYLASISDISRECRIIDGQLRMRIGIAGRVVAGSTAAQDSASLPIRVAIVRGSDVLYSELGNKAVALNPGEGASQFMYVDENVSIPEPGERNLRIFAGFDEGPPQG